MDQSGKEGYINMARRIWKDRIVEKPRTFNIQNNPDGTITLVPNPGAIVEEGTPVNATNLNGLEDDLASHLEDNTKHKTSQTIREESVTPLRLEVISSAGQTPTQGRAIFDTLSGKPKFGNGSAWV